MSLKKQVKQLKAELQRRDEQPSKPRKAQDQTRCQELEYEIEIYREELLRLRSLLAQY